MKLLTILLSVVLFVAFTSCEKSCSCQCNSDMRSDFNRLQIKVFEQEVDISRMSSFVRNIAPDTSIFINGNHPIYLSCSGGGASINVYVSSDSVNRARKKN
jgi:hypothetical protein